MSKMKQAIDSIWPSDSDQINFAVIKQLIYAKVSLHNILKFYEDKLTFAQTEMLADLYEIAEEEILIENIQKSKIGKLLYDNKRVVSKKFTGIQAPLLTKLEWQYITW